MKTPNMQATKPQIEAHWNAAEHSHLKLSGALELLRSYGSSPSARERDKQSNRTKIRNCASIEHVQQESQV